MNSVGLDLERLAPWFADHVLDAAPLSRSERIAGGNSNLTFRVDDADGRSFVVRRPPLHGVLATANDMGREWRAIAGLQHTAVPVPPAVGFCEDESVIGAPFFVTGFVEGFVPHDLASTEASTILAQRAVLADSMVEVLADLHAVDLDATGLADHGRRGQYLERQLRRWDEQYRATTDSVLPDMDTAVAALRDRLPPEGETVMVHGDFRLGNLIIDPRPAAVSDTAAGSIAAVVDWEISTLGDPLADLGFLLVTWARPGTDVGELTEAATLPSMAAGFREADEVAEDYARRTGRDLADLDWYVAFNHWRFACIMQGVATRAREGALGTADGAAVEAFTTSVRERAALAVRALDAG